MNLVIRLSFGLVARYFMGFFNKVKYLGIGLIVSIPIRRLDKIEQQFGVVYHGFYAFILIRILY